MLEPTGDALGKAHGAGRFHPTKKRKVDERELKYSHYYRDERGWWFKSCPKCSRKVGKLVWYELGSFSHRTMPNGQVLPQSWCGECRSGRK